jgi:predicted CopG family antitoxin
MKNKEYIKYMVLTYIMATTIAISQDLKLKLKNLGRAGDSYEDVIRKMYEFNRKSILQAYLYDTTDSITVDEAIARTRKEWQK